MDSLIAAAARALAAGDPLGALQRVALRKDPPALALRGIAMAQLGEYPRARELLRQAARGFGPHEALAQARCVVAEAEVALALRELAGPPKALLQAAQVLEAGGDQLNARQAWLVAARRWLLLGRLGEAEAAWVRAEALALPPSAVPAAVALGEVAGSADAQQLPAQGALSPVRSNPAALPTASPPSPSRSAAARAAKASTAMAALSAAELALRSLRVADARQSLSQARQAAERSGVPALQAEVAKAMALLGQPAARRLGAGRDEPLRLDEVAALMASGALVVDACRHGLQLGEARWPLARRPVLFALARALAEAWPGDASREALIAGVFRTREPDETHRARLRVEIGRLRRLLADVAQIAATPGGFALTPHGGREVVLIAPPVAGDTGALLALLADGLAWSTSALALALGESQRNVQRELAELEAAGRVRAIGQARARRWLAPPLTGFTTILLLPAALSPA